MFCKMRSGNNLTCDKSRPWDGFLLSATAFYHVVGVNGMIEKISPFSIAETFARLEKPKTQEGSPPRVRGILAEHKALKVLNRITPACAGNTVTGFAPEISG